MGPDDAIIAPLLVGNVHGEITVGGPEIARGYSQFLQP